MYLGGSSVLVRGDVYPHSPYWPRIRGVYPFQLQHCPFFDILQSNQEIPMNTYVSPSPLTHIQIYPL